MNKFKGFPSADKQKEMFFRDKNRRVSCKRQSAGSVSGVDSDRNIGVWFRSECSGLLYRNHKAAGDVDLIIVDGISFEPTKKQNS